MAIHICAIAYMETKGGPWKFGVASIEAPGFSNVLGLIDDKGYPVVASDGGSIALWKYFLQPEMGAMTVNITE